MTESKTIPGNTAEIKLDFPFTTLGGVEISTVTMRSPTVRDRLINLKSNKPESDATLDLIANLCGLEASDLMNMEVSDYFLLEKQFIVFLLPLAKRAKVK